jgi:hypothetical protein
MARYIDVDKVELKGLAVFDENLDVLVPLSVVRKALQMTPTADVVPKSEVDKWFRECEELQGRLIELEKEVAREVIADMREQIQGYENIDIILDRIEKKYTEDINDGT